MVQSILPQWFDGVQATGSVSALDASSSWVAGGLASGHAAVLDERAGSLTAFWRAHEASITALAAVESHRLLTASQVLKTHHTGSDFDSIYNTAQH